MRIQISTKTCSYCKDILTNWDYRFQGKHYCRACYDRFFELTECILCHKQKKIFIFLTQRICKKCLVKDKPCIRCGKQEYKHGLISKYGPVCNSCSLYFREEKQCSVCLDFSPHVWYRNVRGTKPLLCNKCYIKTLPICSHCARRKYIYQQVQGKQFCKLCATERDRVCKQCNSLFPAGRGRICKSCAYDNTLKQKVQQYLGLFTHFTQDHFSNYTLWLKKRRGVLYASTHIQVYVPFFSEIDTIAQELQKFPSYEELLLYVSVAKTRQYLLVTLYLHDIGIITIDKKSKEKYANLDMIERLLNYFNEEYNHYQILLQYYHSLQLTFDKTVKGIRGLRLALTPAVKFLKYLKHFPNQEISDDALYGYLWVYKGQQSSIYRFITFLNTHHGFSLKAHRSIIQLSTPRYTRAQLKQKLITHINHPKEGNKFNQQLLQIALGYLHGIDLPNNAFVNTQEIKKDTTGTFYLQLHGERFFLPIEVTQLLKNNPISN